MMLYKILMSFALLLPHAGHAGGFLPTEKLFISKFEAKQSELKTVQDQFENLKKESENKVTVLLDEIKQDIAKTKYDLASEPENEFYLQRLVHLNDRYQVLKDYRQARERLLVTYQELIQLLT